MSGAEKKLLIQLPEAERGLGSFHIARFDKLKRKLARTDLRLPDRARAEDELAELIAAPKAAAEQASLDRSLAETVALAAARGEDVRKDGKTGRTRILSRGGLCQAYEDRLIDPLHGPLSADDLYSAGKRYRDAYEVSEGLTTGRGGGSGFGPKGPQPRMLEAAYTLAKMREKLSQRQIDVLDLVCGQDVRLRVAATELKRGFPGCRNSLRGGLAIIAELKIEMPKIEIGGEKFSVKEYTDRQSNAIAKAMRVA